MDVNQYVTPNRVQTPSAFSVHRRPFASRRIESLVENNNMAQSGSASNLVAAEVEAKSKEYSDGHLASRKAEEAASRRYQAAAWIRSMVDVVDMATEPSEEEFRLCLRNGLILCSLINKVHPGAVPKVVENVPSHYPEGKPLSAYQYFENVKNFLVAAEEMKLPTFEASYLEQGSVQSSSTAKIVDCILALKSYYEWKKAGGNGSWKNMGLLKSSPMIARNTGVNSQCTSSCALQFPEAIKSKEHDPHTGQIQHVDAEQMLIEIIHSKELVGDWVNRLVAEVANSKENIDRNLSEAFRVLTMNGSINILRDLILSVLSEKQREKYSSIGKLQDQEIQQCSKSTEQNTVANRNAYMLSETHKREVTAIKALFQRTREEFQVLQTEYQRQFELIGKEFRGLSTAAAGYHTVLQENKNLYNILQDLKGNIRVYCRVRPPFQGQSEAQSTVDYIGKDGSLLIANPLKVGKDARKMFNFNKVFGPLATQEEVYLDTQPLIRSVMDGYNVCIFAYGQTGSGKTHTMSGPTGASEKDMGVNYRALNDLFDLSQKRKNIMKYEVSVQMIEIYNEQVRDLLATDVTNKKLDIRNGAHNNGFNVPEASILPVTSTSDVLSLMTIGLGNRAVSFTALNDRSSRSHSVLTVHVQGTDNVSKCTLHSCLHLVDLAGSERVDKSEVTGDRLKEAQHINKSLSALGDVIAALAQKNSHVPYRNSKLTQLLQDSLGGQAKTLMFVHMSPELDSYGETISTLKFAERVASVELGTARMNKESGEVRELREQLEGLKKTLARKEAEQNAKVSPGMLEKYKTRTENSNMLDPGCRNAEPSKEGLSKIPTYNGMYSSGVVSQDKKFADTGEKQMSKANRRSSLAYGSEVPSNLSAKIVDTSQTQMAKTEKISSCYPPRTPEHNKSTSSPTDVSPSTVIDTSANSCLETERSGTKSQNVATTTPSTKTPIIRKSQHIFGKLINGYDKRTPSRMESFSPVSSNERRLSNGAAQTRLSRRQSITGGCDPSRRFSLGGKIPVESKPTTSPQGHVETHSKTSPAPAQQSSKTGKRWL